MPRQLLIRLVDQLEYMLGTTQKADETRRLRKQPTQLIAFILNESRPGDDRRLDLLRRLTSGFSRAHGTLQLVQLGNIHGVLQDGEDLALVIEQRRMRRAPIAVLIGRTAAGAGGDRIADHGQGIHRFGTQNPSKRVEKFIDMG